MKIIDSLHHIDPIENAVVTLGTFDGVHIGHQKILRRINGLSNASNGKSVVITFWPHPRFVLGNGWGELRLLTTFEEKARLLAENGVDVLIKVPFTRSFSELSSEEFIRGILIEKVGTQKLVIGYDHKFGKNREGSFEYLKENQASFGFEIEEISKQEIDHIGISSTKIRKSLGEGDVEGAAKLLGRDYTLQGLVAKGDQLGRKFGFPTANIYIPEEYKLIPADGVYAVEVLVGEEVLGGMMNIGYRPTVDGKTQRIEVHIFDFDQDIYGLQIQVRLKKMLRAEEKFSSPEALIAQLEIDKKAAKEALNV